MPTPFATRDAKLSASIDRAFGETFTFLAYVASGDVNLPKIADVSRASFDATGVWEGAAKSSIPHARGSIQDDNAHGWNVSMPSASFDDGVLKWQVRQGDRIRRNFDGAIYQVSAPLPDGMGRTIFLLTSRKSPL